MKRFDYVLIAVIVVTLIAALASRALFDIPPFDPWLKEEPAQINEYGK